MNRILKRKDISNLYKHRGARKCSYFLLWGVIYLKYRTHFLHTLYNRSLLVREMRECFFALLMTIYKTPTSRRLWKLPQDCGSFCGDFVLTGLNILLSFQLWTNKKILLLVNSTSYVRTIRNLCLIYYFKAHS